MAALAYSLGGGFAGKRRKSSIGGAAAGCTRPWSRLPGLSATNEPSFFTARHRRRAPRRGKKRAIVTVAHSLLVAIYHLLRDGTTFQDFGPQHWDDNNRDRTIQRSVHRLEQLGLRSPSTRGPPDVGGIFKGIKPQLHI